MVVFYKDYQQFLQQLQELGLMDVSISEWKASDEERNMLEKIKDYQQAVKNLKSIEYNSTSNQVAKKSINVEKALEIYKNANASLAKLKTEKDKLVKEADELAVWGEFDKNHIEKLQNAGLCLHFYALGEKRFEEFKNLWNEKYFITEISHSNKNVYFVIPAAANEHFEFDIAELKQPDITHVQALQNIAQITTEIENQQNIINQSVTFVGEFEEESTRLSDELHLSKAINSGEEAADGKLLLLEGWATVDTQKDVENLLDSSSAFYIKDKPTPEDNTPVKLKNNRFARLFEFIGQFYTLPKYGTTDMTPYCAPFYIFFFGFCLCDGGYGLIFLALGLYIAKKMKNVVIRRVGWLAFWCGISTFLFGIATGSVFGVQLKEFQLFEPYQNMFLEPGHLFYFAIGVGIVHILLAMGVKAYSKVKYFGFAHALSTIGWMLVLISVITSELIVPKLGLNIPFGTEIFWGVFGLGMFFMFFCNSPGKNPFINFGAGLWNTYNDVTGILGDTLSYLRLFALGLSGGILAKVFNSLAIGMSPDIIILKQFVVILILSIGHFLNLAMSALGAFVHPMRLTFVEFYKNAGFEAGQRVFTPLKKEKK
jgi:V/A-type H+-transporting ATPase subunit I